MGTSNKHTRKIEDVKKAKEAGPRLSTSRVGTILRIFPWIGLLGVVLLFGAWVLQNKVTADLAQERAELDRSQLTVDLQQLRLEAWTRMYNEQLTADRKNQELLGMSAAKALQAYTQIVFYSDLRVETDETKKEQIRRGMGDVGSNATLNSASIVAHFF